MNEAEWAMLAKLLARAGMEAPEDDDEVEEWLRSHLSDYKAVQALRGFSHAFAD